MGEAHRAVALRGSRVAGSECFRELPNRAKQYSKFQGRMPMLPSAGLLDTDWIVESAAVSYLLSIHILFLILALILLIIGLLLIRVLR